jgi:hypothetical protein
MTLNFQEFEDRIIKSLRNSGLIEKFSLQEYYKTADLGLIIEIFTKPSKIFFDEDGLYYFDQNNEKAYCPQMKTSISDRGVWLSQQLPEVGFDIDQNGNVRKADESEALFCCIQVAHILKENEFKDELIEISKQYDFKEMKSNVEGGITFRELLNDWQSLQSVTLNVIVSAAKFKISDNKKDSEKFLKDGIPETAAGELRDLESRIRGINFRYSEGDLSPKEVKKLTKIERLQKINERDDEISVEVIKSSIGKLYKAINLSSEYISPIKKKKINLWVQREVDDLISKPEFAHLKEERASIISKYVRRAYRFEKNSIRRLCVERYIASPDDFRIPPKL